MDLYVVEREFLDDVVLSYLSMYGPVSFRSMEDFPPRDITVPEARATAQRLVGAGKVRIDGNLKLSITEDGRSQLERQGFTRTIRTTRAALRTK